MGAGPDAAAFQLAGGIGRRVGFGTLFFLRVGQEEAMMEERFGQEYRDYRARTKRLVPGIFLTAPRTCLPGGWRRHPTGASMHMPNAWATTAAVLQQYFRNSLNSRSNLLVCSVVQLRINHRLLINCGTSGASCRRIEASQTQVVHARIPFQVAFAFRPCSLRCTGARRLHVERFLDQHRGGRNVKPDPRAETKSRSDDSIHKVERFTSASEISGSSRTGEVYLLRGLMDIFSRGMDEMAAKLNRAGVYALSTSYSNWHEIADEIVARDARGQVSYPVIIMGHSLGGNDAPKMATYLGEHGVKISYVATFDPTEPGRLGKNIGKVVNYYLPNDNNRLYRGAGFTGTLDNVNVTRMDVSHTHDRKESGAAEPRHQPGHGVDQAAQARQQLGDREPDSVALPAPLSVVDP